jgi:hypothetical protein
MPLRDVHPPYAECIASPAYVHHDTCIYITTMAPPHREVLLRPFTLGKPSDAGAPQRGQWQWQWQQSVYIHTRCWASFHSSRCAPSPPRAASGRLFAKAKTKAKGKELAYSAIAIAYIDSL